MNRLRNCNAFYMVLSILAAIILWLYVDLVNQPDIEQEYIGIPVVFEGEEALAENGLMLLHDGTETVDLTISAKRATHQKLNRNNIVITAKVDTINSVGSKSLRYTYSFPSTVSNSEVDVVDRSVYSIDVNVVRLLTKSIPLQGEFTGSLAEGYQAGEFSFDPLMIEVSGEESLVESIDHARVTLSEQGLSSAYTGELPYVLVDGDGQPVDSKHLSCDVDRVDVTFPVVILREIPLSVDFIAGGGAGRDNVTWQISPSYITVSGEQSILEPLREIIVGAVDLSKVVSSGTYSFEIPLYSELSNVSGETHATVDVAVNMDGLATTTLETTEIELINLPENCRVTPVTNSIQVLLRGKEESLPLVMTHNLRAVADLSNVTASAGRYTVPVTVYVDGFSDVGAVGEYRITVSIR